MSLGTTHVVFSIDRTGRVRNPKIVSNSSNETFANVCLQSIIEIQLPPIPEDIASTLPPEGLDEKITFTMFPNEQPHRRTAAQQSVTPQPESKTATTAPGELEHAIVTVSETDEIKLDGRTITVEELEAAVRNLPETRRSSLALQGDKKASFDTIVKVMDALKRAGVKKLQSNW
jgi:Biopolymer transport protein ExbD/TolR